MIGKVLDLIVGTQNKRQIKKLQAAAEQIGELEARLEGLSPDALKAESVELKKRLHERIEALGGGLTQEGRVPAGLITSGDDDAYEAERKKRLKHESQALEEILPDAFALVRETSKRILNMRHYDVQFVGGMVLHQGKIAEMTTGEGKTLVATLPVYLNALIGRGVHVVTVNDYLARRDRDWMAPLYEALGLSVGVVQHDMPPQERRAAYHSDITYGTNNEFGFDYLRDNMTMTQDDCVQRCLHFAIVDEVDSILIDEARTPLIISGPAEQSTELYYKIDRMIPKLKLEDDYTIDEKAHSATLTEEGVTKVEALLGLDNLYDGSNISMVHHVVQGLRAHNLYKRDVDYMIKDGQIVIVDEFTGRLMPGRRWSDGLHQAVEAKEGVTIERENQTLATVTFQNYFRMYDKLAGMTGTAETEAAEFHQIYKLDVVSIPTNRVLQRESLPDVVFRTQKEKYDSVVEEIAEMNAAGRPVLAGTVSIEKSEHLSALLKQRNIPHVVLNAKYHEHEAQIVGQAGRLGRVTIATNMAGRGTDILLGGNPELMAVEEIKRQQGDGDELSEAQQQAIREEIQVKLQEEHDKVIELGGLHVIGTERHESRRIDNQLRGRCGRQGDPGSSRFYLSLEDDLLRLFGENKLLEWTKSTMPEGEAIEHPLLNRAIETAQKRVESHNFDIRKRLLEYDDVMNRQREIIYKQRRSILVGHEVQERVEEMIDETVQDILTTYASEELDREEWDLEGFRGAGQSTFGIDLQGIDDFGLEDLEKILRHGIGAAYKVREEEFGKDEMRKIEQFVLLQVMDGKWKDHLYGMDQLREGIGYRVYGQQDPLIEYKHEAFQMFSVVMESIRTEVVPLLFRIQKVQAEQISSVFAPTEFSHPDAPEQPPQAPPAQAPQVPLGGQSNVLQGGGAPARQPAPASTTSATRVKVGRNDPCPCESGKKYKKCCYPQYE